MHWRKRMFRRGRMRDDLSEEMRQHLEEKIEALIADGMPREEAIHAARRAFGNTTLLEEHGREVWMWPWIESVWADVRFGSRQIGRSPGITLIAILTLALGIGANTAVFTLTWAVILKTLPVPHPDKLVEYVMDNGEPTTIGLSGPEYALLRARQKTCTDLLAWASDAKTLTLGDRSQDVRIQMLTENAFQVLQMRPYLGNFFHEQDHGREDTHGIPAVLSYDFWKQEFHGEAQVLGQSFFIDNHPVTVIGVMPRTFAGLTANFHPQVYLPLSFLDLLYGKNFLNNPGHFGLYVLGRLKPGMTLTTAQNEVKALEPSIRKEADPSGVYMNQRFKAFRLRVQSGRSGVSWVKMMYERPLLVLEMLIAFLLALCCLNTALVMMARVSGRRQEYAVRSALGAGQMRLIRQVLVETTLLIIPGLIAGVLIGWLAAHALIVMLGANGGASSMDVRPNAMILGFDLTTSLVVALGAGLWPALRVARITPALDMKKTERGISAGSFGGWAIIIQVAVSVCLVTTALLLGGTLTHLLTEDSGFRMQGAAFASIDLHSLKLTDAATGRIAGELLRELQRRPGIEAAGYVSTFPLEGFSRASSEFSIDDKNHIHSDPNIFSLQVSPGYFHAIGTQILEGNNTAPFAQGAMQRCVVGRTAAANFFPGENPLGQVLYTSTWPQPDGTNLDPKHACKIVGMAEDAHFLSLRSPAPHMVYNVIRPETLTAPILRLAVRAGSNALALTALKDTVQQVIPDAIGTRYRTFHQLEDADLSRERMLMSLSGTFALLALLLTALGLYGLLARSVALRTREIGIRMALGAPKPTIAMAILKRAIVDVSIGILAGTVGAVLLIHVVRRMMAVSYGHGPWNYLASTGMILLVGILSAWIPARRAVSVDPMQALRAE